MSQQRKVVVIGGGGYVGSALCPSLVSAGYDVVAFDTFWYGDHVLPHSVKKVRGDIRNISELAPILDGAYGVIHLACISNDPSFDLNPALGRSINLESFPAICEAVQQAEVNRFIYASSSSVYGVHEGNVTEETPCFPLTDYSLFKLECEKHLERAYMNRTLWTIVRPATVCGFAPRLRLDLIVNALTASALTKRKITVHGGEQLRPNLHIKDMIQAYELILSADMPQIHRKTFNVGSVNASVTELSRIVSRAVADPELTIEHTPTNDTRSYHIDWSKIKKELGFWPGYGLAHAVESLREVYPYLTDPLENPQHHNIKRMKELGL